MDDDEKPLPPFDGSQVRWHSGTGTPMEPNLQHEDPNSPAAKLASLWAQPHGGSCFCRECIARDQEADGG